MHINGSCLCGQISFQISEPIKSFKYCHCSRCQKVTGSAHASNLFVPPEQFEWLTGQHLVKRFELTQARFFAHCFCSVCGSSLPWQVQGGPTIVIPAGSLDDDPKVRPKHSIFWEERAPWYKETCDLEKLPPR